MIKWRPAPDSHSFDIRAERAVFVTYDGKGQTRIRRRAAGGEETSYRAGI